MVSHSNYYQIVKTFNFSELPENLQTAYKYVEKVTEDGKTWGIYNDSEKIRNVIDRYFEKLNAWLQTHKGSKKAESPKPKVKDSPGKEKSESKKIRPEKKVAAKKPVRKQPSPAKEKDCPPSNSKSKEKKKKKKAGVKSKAAKVPSKLIRDMGVELTLMRRFIALSRGGKTFQQVLAVYNALNRAIEKGFIRKTKNPTPYHKQMGYIQQRLNYVLNDGFKGKDTGKAVELNFDEKKIKEFEAEVKQFEVYPSVRFAMRFIGMQGKAPDTAKAEKLLATIKKAESSGRITKSDPNKVHIKEMTRALTDYIGGKSNNVQVESSTLAGIYDALAGCGCGLPEKKNINGMSEDEDNDEPMERQVFKWNYHDERGDFHGWLNDRDDNEIFSIGSMEELNEFIEDGFIRHADDTKGLHEYLVDMGIIEEEDLIIKSHENFEDYDNDEIDGIEGSGESLEIFSPETTTHSASAIVKEGSTPQREGEPGQGEYYIAPTKGKAISYRSDKLPDHHNDNVLNFTGRWEQLLNRPNRGFSSLIYGMPKSGKSTLAADFGGYLAREFGKVLYASIEEGVRETFTERIERLNAEHPNMDVKNYLPRDLSRYDFVITDSVSRGQLDIYQMRRLLRDWPNTTFIFLFHTTKGGLPRGTNEFLHEVDIIVKVDGGKAIADGRFGPGEMQIRFE